MLARGGGSSWGGTAMAGSAGHRDRARRIGWRFVATLVALLFGAALTATSTRAATPLPIRVASVPFPTTATIQTYTLDLGTLPARPALVVELTPDPAHPNMQLQVELTNWAIAGGPGACPGPANSIFSTGGPGPLRFVDFTIQNCDPRPGQFVGETVDLKIRALNFGGVAGPASVVLQIRGETRPPTGTVSQTIDTFLGPHQASFLASKDTVLYEDGLSASNGAGEFLWSGEKVVLFPFTIRSDRRALLAFDVSPTISPVSVVDAVELRVAATSLSGGGGQVNLWRVATGVSSPWKEGDANAAGTEFDGASSFLPAANWMNRDGSFSPWAAPGGDVVGLALAGQNITTLGAKSYASPALTAAVQDMVDTGLDDDGFLMAGPIATLPTRAVQLASAENGSGAQRPELVVEWTPTALYSSGDIKTGTKSFISEGQNFRWIYDLDHDDILVTSVGGICEVVDTTSPQTLPYTYHFQGAPGYTGVDCCAWRIDSPQTGTIGTGQALFFHNLDAGNPANLPPDTDQDGIRDNCDNCVTAPNGPLRGSCRAGPTLGAPCRSNGECGAGGICSLSQEDANNDFTGDVCAPEPGFAAGLAGGLAGLAFAARADRRRRAVPD